MKSTHVVRVSVAAFSLIAGAEATRAQQQPAGQASPPPPRQALSQEDRMAKQASSMALKLLPVAPDAARVRGAMLTAGLDPAIATQEKVAPFVERERAAYDAWRKEAEVASNAMVLKTMKDDPGSMVIARDIPAIKTRYEEGRNFEINALSAALRECSATPAQSHLAIDIAVANYPAPGMGGLRGVGRLGQVLVDILEAAIAADPDHAQAFRESLASYEGERARLAADLLVAELEVMTRNKAVAIAAQNWARHKASGDDASAMSHMMEGVAMVAMLAPFMARQTPALEMQYRALAAVDSAMPADQAWIVYSKVFASDPATAFAAKAVAAADAELAKLPPDQAEALRASLRDFKIADHKLMRESLSNARKEAADSARVLKSLANADEVTEAMIDEIAELSKASEYGPSARADDARRIMEARREGAKALTKQAEAASAAANAPPSP